MNKHFIEIKSINKSFRSNTNEEIKVLENFSLNLSKGEILSIYGPNGCGKTTILSIIAQLLEYDSGDIMINSKKPKTGEVGYLFQDYSSSLFPWLSCAENISFSLRLDGTSSKKRLSKALALVKDLGINININKYPYELSGGQQQLIALARALCNSPSAIVMDEPFSSLDATMREKIRAEVISIINNLGITAVIVSHNLEDCIITSDRVVFLTNVPANIFRIEKVPEEIKRNMNKIHSDLFADVLNHFNNIASEAQSK